ncbi:uncharacterized protein LOC103979003 [Musa acuminata AAA Group]|uniref:uncharacterized protein LOC103979003 n=1 Tax=Musa acuminata AAA Group TaxID=214697 RepID=UPI0005120E9D|nr:PREDICTED: uncharacterized protein LOC103979003 [Musa acuminata subsp. malaccensis]
MAVSDTASKPTEWVPFDRRSVGQPPPLAPAVFGPSSESIVVTAASSPTASGGTPRPETESRVVRPARRRTRASRRAPVTLLITDTSNFRAMVQQFTGFPSGPYSSSYRPGFGLDFSDPQTTVAPPGHLLQPTYLEHQYEPHQHHHHRRHPQQYQYTQTPFRLDRSNGSSLQHDAFLRQSLHNYASGLEMDDVFLLGGMPSQMTVRPASTDSRIDGYLHEKNLE